MCLAAPAALVADLSAAGHKKATAFDGGLFEEEFLSIVGCKWIKQQLN